jgi:MFS family permease
MVALALFPSPLVAYLALVLVGIGNAIEDAAGFTMVARLAPPKMVGRELAAAELLALTAIALGSLVAPWLIATIEVQGTLAVLGGVVTVLALANLMRFRRLDQTMPAPGPELELIRDLPMFEHLSLAVSELVAGELRQNRYEAGAVVVREGDSGDEFHLVLAGTAAVTVHGSPRPPLGRGDCFGEIALLRDVPRTATITATETLQTLALGRTEFLTAISGNPLSVAAADAVVTAHLATDPPITDRPQDL